MLVWVWINGWIQEFSVKRNLVFARERLCFYVVCLSVKFEQVTSNGHTRIFMKIFGGQNGDPGIVFSIVRYGTLS